MESLTKNREFNFIKENISSEPYNNARFAIVDIYPKLELDFSKISSTLIDRATKDIAIFADIENKRISHKRPIAGDAILRKEGRTTYVAIFLSDSKFQDSEGGSFCIDENGSSYSGGFTMNVLSTNDLKLTDKKTPLKCWIFSSGFVGGNRGVYSTINVKTWEEI